MESHEMHLLIAAGAYPPLCSSAMRARPLLLLLSLTAACESTRQAFPDSDTTTTTGGSSVHGTTTGDPGGTGDDTTGSETTGDDTTGGDSTGESATGDDTTTGDTTGDETTGEDSTGDDSTGGSTTGGDATGGPGWSRWRRSPARRDSSGTRSARPSTGCLSRVNLTGGAQPHTR